MMFSSAYSQLSQIERGFADDCIAALIRQNADRYERLTVTLERFANALVLDNLDERVRDQLAKPIVRAAILERVETIARERDVSHERIIQEHQRIAFANINRFFQVGEDGIPQFDASDCTDEDWAAVAQVDVEETYGRGATTRKVKIKMYNKQQSLDTLAKYSGLDKDGNPIYAAYNALAVDPSKLASSATVEQLAEEYARFIG